ncbi:NAD-dependent epimerase/dehydratase family protein [Succinimonas sp.]|uniref:NAD-dependent epimerase/dehydratase family protein n=1 Tax=Succinimonas sp. TaxID=1936151 RepID=UPI0038658C8D
MSSDTEERFSFLKGKKVLLTGGTGFVGRHLLPLLLGAGAEVTCLVRASSATRGLPAGVKIREADFAAGTGLYEALAGQDMVIHLAALLFGFSQQDYLRANAAMARQFAKALRRLREEGRLHDEFRFTLVSSQAATGPWRDPPGAPDDVMPSPVSAYGWSKLLTEEILGRKLGSQMVTLRPPIIYGSGDRGLLPMFRAAKTGLAFCPGWHREFRVSAVHADDLARAVLYLCRPEAHGVYHVSDGSVYTMEEFYRAMGEAVTLALGRPRWRRPLILQVPLPVITLSAAVSSVTAGAVNAVLKRFTGHGLARAPQWNLDKCREARQEGWICDGSRLTRELGFIPEKDLAAGMKEAAEGYRRDGWL